MITLYAIGYDRLLGTDALSACSRLVLYISHAQNSKRSKTYPTRSIAVLGDNLCGCLILLKRALPSEIEPGFWCAA